MPERMKKNRRRGETQEKVQKNIIRAGAPARILMMLAISLMLTMAGTPQLQPISGVPQLQPISGVPQLRPISGVFQFQPLTAAAEELPVTSIPHFADRFYLRNLAPELQRDAAAVYQGIAAFEEEIVLPDETGYDSIERIFFVLKYDCPELFQVSFDSGTLLKTYNGIVHSIKPSYVMGREEYAQRLAQCREILGQMIREAETYAGQPRKIGRGAGASGPGAGLKTGPGAGTASGPGAGLETGPGAGLGTGSGAGLETGPGVGLGTGSATELTRQEAAELYLYDRLTDWITYSTTAPGCENAYGALVGRAAKCDGISIAMKWVMEEIGIPAMVITGHDQNDPGGHAWNCLQIDGVWHDVDLTNDSASPGRSMKIYPAFNVRRDWMARMYPLSPVVAAYSGLPVPDSMDRSYHALNGTFVPAGTDFGSTFTALLDAAGAGQPGSMDAAGANQAGANQAGAGSGTGLIQFEDDADYRRFMETYSTYVNDWFQRRGRGGRIGLSSKSEFRTVGFVLTAN